MRRKEWRKENDGKYAVRRLIQGVSTIRTGNLHSMFDFMYVGIWPVSCCTALGLGFNVSQELANLTGYFVIVQISIVRRLLLAQTCVLHAKF